MSDKGKYLDDYVHVFILKCSYFFYIFRRRTRNLEIFLNRREWLLSIPHDIRPPHSLRNGLEFLEEFLRGYFKNLEYLGELYFWRGCRILVKIQGWHNVYCRYRECCTKFIPKFADSGKYFYIVDETMNQEVSFVLIWMLFKWRSKLYDTHDWLAFTLNLGVTNSHKVCYSNLDSPLNVA